MIHFNNTYWEHAIGKIDDLIKRQDAITAYCEHECGKGMTRENCGCDDCGTIFDDIPSAQPDRKKGKWIITKTERGWNCAEYPTEVTCSNCNYIEDYQKALDFCPNCGADMRGES